MTGIPASRQAARLKLLSLCLLISDVPHSFADAV